MYDFNSMTDAQLDRAVERHWDMVWERMNAPTPYEEACEMEIWEFINDHMDEDYEEEWELYCEDLGVDPMHAQHLRDAFDTNFLRDHEDEIANKYNNWIQNRRTW